MMVEIKEKELKDKEESFKKNFHVNNNTLNNNMILSQKGINNEENIYFNKERDLYNNKFNINKDDLI